MAMHMTRIQGLLPSSFLLPRLLAGGRGGPSSRLIGALSLGFAGAFSLLNDAEAKERPSPELVPHNVVLYQYEACPFCNKVKVASLCSNLESDSSVGSVHNFVLKTSTCENENWAFLDYHDIAYKVVEVNPLSKKQIKWSDYKKVPILTVDGEPLVGSSDIVDHLRKRIHPNTPVLEDYADSEEKKWCRWVDDHLVHVLSPNIYRSTSEALESFDYITEHSNFTSTERWTVKYAGAAAMYLVSKRLKKRHNITDERAALYEAAETWVEALNGRDFLGGSKPNSADLAVFGVLRPIRYLRSGRDMIENTCIGEWYMRMELVVGESARIKV
ncbi:prostaglandin E synthase 2 isoform X2 [Amborella trichopoda]|uniref:prostaglandin E synthase 2 isoform X2 n=1 Tax=Amborella trichopoda TaxID=13333 RepID=UPI0009BE4B70|nr:prostaglandin E synthase 2 isoform X2 [Amborella trichopoda]|eukprot:XP_020524397.1 prostaglandin E synthase 2 isoform X2 [Amborella trichopoda]